MTAAIDVLAVTGLGMVSSLGHNAVSSCAAARAGISLARELKVLAFSTEGIFGRETLEGPPAVFGHVVRGIAEGFVGVGQALLLGAAALKDLLSQRPLSERELTRTGLCINLSDHFVQDSDPQQRQSKDATAPSAAWKQACGGLLSRLCDSAGLWMIPEPQRQLHHGGNAGLAAVVRDAAARMAGGQIDRCLVGGIDSRTGADFLWAAARLNMLRTNDNPVGLIPGEAAAFFLLERPADASRGGLSSSALVTGAYSDSDPVDLLADKPPTGAALARVIRAALATNPSTGLLIGDLDGTQRRAMEWGLADVRLRGERAITTLPSWFPASAFGNSGAAAGAVGVAMASRAFSRGYAPAGEALVWLSSESGSKGAITIRAHGR